MYVIKHNQDNEHKVTKTKRKEPKLTQKTIMLVQWEHFLHNLIKYNINMTGALNHKPLLIEKASLWDF